MVATLINLGVNWPDVPGMVRGFAPDRQWKGLLGGYSEAAWTGYLASLPRDAYVIVDDEDPKADPRVNSAADVRACSDRRVELHRVLRRVRPDLRNADGWGPCPLADTPGPVWNDGPMLRRWRAGNAVTVPPVLPHLTHLAVELYFTGRPQTAMNPAATLDDYRRFRDANVAEARRWADGRPVIGLVWLRTKGGAFGWGRYVGDALAHAMLDELRPMVDAVAVWDCQFTIDGRALPAQPYPHDDPALARARAFAASTP